MSHAEGLTRGKAAMLAMWRERPNEFVKSVFSVLPRELLFENITAELADDELDRMIEALRERVLTAREEQPALLSTKVIEHVN